MLRIASQVKTKLASEIILVKRKFKNKLINLKKDIIPLCVLVHKVPQYSKLTRIGFIVKRR